MPAAHAGITDPNLVSQTLFTLRDAVYSDI